MLELKQNFYFYFLILTSFRDFALRSYAEKKVLLFYCIQLVSCQI